MISLDTNPEFSVLRAAWKLSTDSISRYRLTPTRNPIPCVYRRANALVLSIISYYDDIVTRSCNNVSREAHYNNGFCTWYHSLYVQCARTISLNMNHFTHWRFSLSREARGIITMVWSKFLFLDMVHNCRYVILWQCFSFSFCPLFNILSQGIHKNGKCGIWKIKEGPSNQQKNRWICTIWLRCGIESNILWEFIAMHIKGQLFMFKLCIVKSINFNNVMQIQSKKMDLFELTFKEHYKTGWTKITLLTPIILVGGIIISCVVSKNNYALICYSYHLRNEWCNLLRDGISWLSYVSV